MIKGKETSEPPRRVADLRIREAVAEDLEALEHLRLQAERTHVALLPDYFRLSPGARTALVVSPAAGVLCASERGEVRGYVAVKVVDTPRDPAITPCRRGHVETVVVDEPHRGRGIGTALMRAAGEWARRRGSVELVLTVWSDNRAADALYDRLGYEPLARILRKAL